MRGHLYKMIARQKAQAKRRSIKTLATRNRKRKKEKQALKDKKQTQM